MNSVCLIGNLTRDPELRHTPGGTAVCQLGIAVNDRKPDGNGGWQEYPHYFDVTVWGKQAENAAQYLAKGRKVGVTGKLEQDRWTTDSGENRSKVRINAFQVDYLTPRDSNGGGGGGYSPAADFAPVGANDDDIPF